MAQILTDQYSVICAIRRLRKNNNAMTYFESADPCLFLLLQNIVLGDEIVLDGVNAHLWGFDELKTEVPNVIRFLQEIKPDSQIKQKAIEAFCSHRRANSITYSYRLYGYDYPYPYYDYYKTGIPNNKENALGFLLERSLHYLRLSKNLGFMLSLHPSRSAFLMSELNQPLDHPISEIVIRRFEQAMTNAPALSYVGVNLKIPAVSEHVLAFAERNSMSPLRAAREIRDSRHAKAFRARCGEIENEIRHFGHRSAFRDMQKLLIEVDTLSAKWQEDIDVEVKYRRRTIPVGSLWGIGRVFKAAGLKEISIKDPVIYKSKPALLFLNDLYRLPRTMRGKRSSNKQVHDI